MDVCGRVIESSVHVSDQTKIPPVTEKHVKCCVNEMMKGFMGHKQSLPNSALFVLELCIIVLRTEL